jgi:hypothetical protein
MNKEIMIYENKTLKLSHVFSKTIVIDDSFNEKPFEMVLKEFDDYMKNNKLLGYGPLIIKSGILGNEEKKMYLKLMRQTKNDSIKCIYPYEYNEEIKTPPCLLSRFEGNNNDSQIASMKMQVYAYEHNLILDIMSYTITKPNEDMVIIDTFIPILGRS